METEYNPTDLFPEKKPSIVVSAFVYIVVATDVANRTNIGAKCVRIFSLMVSLILQYFLLETALSIFAPLHDITVIHT